MTNASFRSRSHDLPGFRVVAFIDILGFRELINRMFGGEPALFRGILSGLLELKSRCEITARYTDSQATSFSDSLIISAPGEGGLDAVMAHLHYIVGDLIRRGVFCRGGISCGRVYHAGGVVLGEGVIRAHDLEKSVAKYPRIVFDDVLAPLLPRDRLPMPRVLKDVDGRLFFNAFRSLWRPAFSLRENIDPALTNSPDVEGFRKVRLWLARQLAAAYAESRQDHLEKLHWIVRQFNKAVEAYKPAG